MQSQGVSKQKFLQKLPKAVIENSFYLLSDDVIKLIVLIV